MNTRERIHAIMNYEHFDRMPVVSFGYWTQTLQKWKAEGHIKEEPVYERPMFDFEYDQINRNLGFDFNWHSLVGITQNLLEPPFTRTVLKTLPDKKQEILDEEGNIILVKPGTASIPMEIGHTLTDRESFRTHYLPRLSYGAEVLDRDLYSRLKEESHTREYPLGLFCGSLFGRMRNWLGLQNCVYLWYDDPDFFTEIVDTVGNLLYRQTKMILELGVPFDYAHFWEDICGNDGPLLPPEALADIAGPHYKKITGLLHDYHITTVSLDCDGKIDALIPIWLKNGVNTMFPIEIGSWNANIADWRKTYGKELKGVGGVDKKIFAQDYKAIDREIERIKPYIALGGYVPCPDHRIPPDAKWENVQYYGEKLHGLAVCP